MKLVLQRISNRESGVPQQIHKPEELCLSNEALYGGVRI